MLELKTQDGKLPAWIFRQNYGRVVFATSESSGLPQECVKAPETDTDTDSGVGCDDWRWNQPEGFPVLCRCGIKTAIFYDHQSVASKKMLSS
jgi:hypothetical protein